MAEAASASSSKLVLAAALKSARMNRHDCQAPLQIENPQEHRTKFFTSCVESCRWPPRGGRFGSLSSTQWRRVALLAIVQRTIHVSRRHIGKNRLPRRSVPTTPTTLGDHISLKRYEKRLLLSQVAEYMGLTVAEVKSFESDIDIPEESEWRSLQEILDLDPRLQPTKPNT